MNLVNLGFEITNISARLMMFKFKIYGYVVFFLLMPLLHFVGGIELTAPSYVSEWRVIDANNSAKSELIFIHGFDIIPYKVEAQVMVDGQHQLVFPGMSSVFRHTFNQRSNHGGTIVVYNETMVKVLVNEESGSVIFTGTVGWDSYVSNDRVFTYARVRVRVWIPCDFPKPQFISKWIEISTLDATVPKAIKSGRAIYPSLVVVQVMDDNGYIVEAQGSSSILFVPSGGRYGGVIYGFSKYEFKIWYPITVVSVMNVYTTQGQTGVMCYPNGWELNSIEFKERAKIRILAWYFSTPARDYHYDPKNYGFIPFSISHKLDESLMVLEVEQITTDDNGFRYYGVGSTIGDGEVDFGGNGGVIYGYTENETFIWVPNLRTGRMINIDGMWTNTGVNASNDARITVKIFQMSHEEICCRNDITVNVTGTNISIEGWNVNNKVQYMCQEGFRYNSGDLQRLCQINGSFSGDPPFCEEIECSKDIVSLNTTGKLYNLTGFKINDRLIYECNVYTHRLTGALTRYCQENGTWSGREPQCEEILCPSNIAAMNISGLLVDVTGFSYNDTLTYTCELETQRLLDGDLRRTCGFNGTWTGKEPKCIEIECSKDIVSLNTTGKLFNLTGFKINDRLIYECNVYTHRLTGALTRYCQENGTWSGREPQCEEIFCPSNIASMNRSGLLVDVTGFSYNDKLTYTCDLETQRLLDGDLQRICGVNGTWTGKEPNCIDIVCPSAIASINDSGLLVDITGFRYKDMLFYSCDLETHILLEGDLQRTCQYNETWNGTEPVCKEIVCSENISALNNSGLLVNATGFKYNDYLTYTCDFETQKLVKGELKRTCQYNGTWSGAEPVCREIRCEKRIDVLNSSGLLTEITGYRYKDVLIYKCDDTHSFVEGNIERTCQNDGSWSGKEPVCEACYCKCETQNITKEGFDELIEEMTVSKKSTTRAKRKLISPYENRPTAKSMGFVAIIFLVFVLCCIVIPDIPVLIKHLF